MEARDLVEAYYQVYEEEELDEGLRLKVAKAALTRTRNLPVGNPLRRTLSTKTQELVAKEADKKREKREKVERRRLQSVSNQNESYDILISYLLDEGYADSYKTAKSIMENMSEDWRDSILEKFISPYEGKSSYNNPQGHSPATRAMQKSDELQRNEPGSKRQKMQTRRSQQLNRTFQAARRA